MKRSTKLLERVATLLNVGIEVRAMRRGGHKASVNRCRNIGVTVKPTIQELNFKGSGFWVIAYGAKVAGRDGRSVHGDTSSVVGERSNVELMGAALYAASLLMRFVRLPF